jgi:hypothetical protein
MIDICPSLATCAANNATWQILPLVDSLIAAGEYLVARSEPVSADLLADLETATEIRDIPEYLRVQCSTLLARLTN